MLIAQMDGVLGFVQLFAKTFSSYYKLATIANVAATGMCPDCESFARIVIESLVHKTMADCQNQFLFKEPLN